MITGDYDQLREMADNSVCAEDNGHLVVAWHKDNTCYYIKCGICGECKAMTRVLSLTEEHRAGEELPLTVKDNVKKSIEKRAQRLPQAPGAETFTGIPATDLDTGELIPIEKLRALVAYAQRYGLDPARGHVALMHGQPYIGIDGYLYHAKRQNIPYSLTGRPLSAAELEAQGYEPSDLGWYSKVVRHDTGQIFEGYGFVKKSETTEKSKKSPDRLRYPVVAEKPGNMVIKRGEWQALRRAFPIGETKEEVNNGQGEG